MIQVHFVQLIKIAICQLTSVESVLKKRLHKRSSAAGDQPGHHPVEISIPGNGWSTEEATEL